MKGTSHGIMDNQTETNVTTQKVEVWTQGIVYYIVKFNNVYDTADIIKNQMNTKIIAKYVKKMKKFIAFLSLIFNIYNLNV